MSLDPIDAAHPATCAINCWVAIKRLGTPTVAEIATELTTLLSDDALDNIGPITTAYAASGIGNLGSLITVSGPEDRYSIPDTARFIQRNGNTVELVPEGTAFRPGYHW